MAWYLIMLEGGPIECPANLQIAGKPNRHLGFITTRKASAKSVTEAVDLAIEDALAELRESLFARDFSIPQCRASEVRKLTWIQAASRKYRGFTFYPWPAVAETPMH